MKKKILIVDDAKALAESLGDILTMEGYAVTIFNDAISAIPFLEDEIPDIIITDMIMPRMSGFEFIRQIKKNKKLMNINVIAVSADLNEELIKEGTTIGVDQFFSKPFDEDKLLKTIDQLTNS